MFLPRPRTTAELLTSQGDFPGDGVKGSEQEIPPPVQAPPMKTLPPPEYFENGVKDAEPGNQPVQNQSPPMTLGAPTVGVPGENLPPKTAMQTAEEKFNSLQNQKTPADNDKGVLKRLGATLRELGKRALQGGAAVDKNASFSERLFAMLGGGLAGAGGYQLDPQVDERENLQNERAKAYREYQIQTNMEKTRLEQARTTAQTQEIQERTKSIPIDDETKRLDILGRKETANERLKNQALTKIFGGKFFDTNNVAHKKLAEQAGLDVQSLNGWDDRNPLEKKVDGVNYRLNRQSGKYEPTNLPIEESKALTDYTIEMPTGEKRTFKVSQEKAANFATQMQTLGARLKQDEIQFGQRREDAAVVRKEAMQKWVIQNKVTWARFRADVMSKVSNGTLSQEDADSALADFPSEFK